MFTRRRFQISIAFTLMLAMLTMATASAQGATLGGTVQIRDAQGSPIGANDALVIAVGNVPAAGSGMQYQGWLVDLDGNMTSTGTFTRSPSGSINRTWVSPENENLAANYVRFVLSREPNPDPDPNTPGTIVYHDSLLGGVIPHFRSLLAASDFTASGDGVATVIRQQVAVAVQHGGLAQDSDTLGEMQTHAQHVINVIEGENGVNFDAGPGNPGDGVGLMEYVDRAIQLANQASAAASEDDVWVLVAADDLITRANRMNDRLTIARDNALQVLDADETNLITEAALANVVGLSTQGQTSARDLYLASQNIGTFVMQSGTPGELPTAGDELVPMLALMALMGGIVLTGGGVMVLRRRNAAAA